MPLLDRARSLLGWALFVVAMLGAVVVLCDCNPYEAPLPGDNTRCRIDGFSEYAVRGPLRIGFPFEGGTVRVSGGGLDRDLFCDIAPAGRVFDPITDELVDE
jgi:hypothetical protein